MDLTDKLIESVKPHTILYDPKYAYRKKFHAKDILWKQIGEELNENDKKLKKKWKNIKDGYIKYLRTLNSKNLPAYLRKRNFENWPWASKMEFLKPYIVLSSNSETTINESPSLHSEDSDNSMSETLCSHPSKTSKTNTEEVVVPSPSFEQLPNQSIVASNATDLIFLGYSKMINTFMPIRQAIAKIRIAQVVMEEEIMNLEEARISSSGENSKDVQEESQTCSSSCTVGISDINRTEIAIKEDPEL